MNSKHYHFIGVGGIGVGALAYLMSVKGHRVSGSDIKENDMTAHLRTIGVQIHIGHEAKNIDGADIIVYSSAISAGNSELSAAQAQNKVVLKRAQLLAELMQGQTGVTIAGAHGKTTTSSMVSDLLTKAGFHPTSAVGGIVNSSTWNAHIGDGKYFVAEVDESDGSFLFFHPKYSIITNIDFEHIDYYHTWENILEAYRKFIGQTASDGSVLVCGDDQKLRTLMAESKRPHLTYGFKSHNDIIAKDESLQGLGSSFRCVFKGNDLGEFKLNVPGRHNILNATAVIGLGHVLSIPLDVIRAALDEFRSVHRRFQVKGEINDILVVDDYGHHPTEIRATLEAAKALKRPRVITVFQPHRYTRTKFLMDEFADNLNLSDMVLLLDIYSASEEPIEGVSTETLYRKMKDLNRRPVEYLDKTGVIPYLLKILKPGDLVLTLGAGDVTHLSDELVKELTKEPHSPSLVKNGH